MRHLVLGGTGTVGVPHIILRPNNFFHHAPRTYDAFVAETAAAWTA